MFELITFGSLAFWICLVVLSIIIIGSLDLETFTFSVVCVAAVAVVMYKSIVGIGVQALLIGSVVYIMIGGIWSVWSWFRHLEDTLREHKNDSSLPQRLIDPYTNKGLIVAWIFYWPWSLFWNCTSNLFTTVYDLLIGVYSRQTERIVRKFDGIKLEKEKESLSPRR